MNLGDIDEWNVGALHSISAELTTELRTVTEVADELEKVSALPGWDSPAADAARGRIASVRGNVLDDAAALGAVQQLAEEAAAAVSTLQSRLAELRALVAGQDGHLSLSPDGEVSITGTPEQVKKLQQLADDIETQAKALITQARDIDDDCAEVLGHVVNGEVRAGGATDTAAAFRAGEDQSGLSAPYPPTGPQTEPKDVTAWWDALSGEEQGRVLAEHPDWIAGRDGVPAPYRSAANLPALDRELAAAESDLAAAPTFQEYFGRHPEWDTATARMTYDAMMAPKIGRADNARAIRDSMLIDPKNPALGYDKQNKFLMLFQPGEHEMNAVVAVGNPDEADCVTVTTPGMNTHATSLPTMVGEATALRDEMHNQLSLNGQPDQKVSAIAWFGYDPPDTADLSVLGALGEDRANAGGHDLANFYRGINATNVHGSGVELSAFGHSYGSTTTAQALNELGEKGVVDNAVFYGSPGLGHANDKLLGVFGTYINDESDLFVDDGHAFVMSAHNDPVSEGYDWHGLPIPSLADAGLHGPNTNSLPFEHLSTAATTTPDGVYREQAVGHSEYPRPFEVPAGDGTTREVLRTTGYNLAIVGAGLADDPKGLLVRE